MDHHISSGHFIDCLALSGNGTLNKQAGIDYKQLSLLAKINENQSGEVSCVHRCVSVLLTLFKLPCCLLDYVLRLQLWQGRWQGDEIVVKVLQVRDWTTRKSRDFNEEHPKLRFLALYSISSGVCTKNRDVRVHLWP